MSVISNNTTFKEFRNRCEDKNALANAGDIYVGTGNKSTEVSTVYMTEGKNIQTAIVEDINRTKKVSFSLIPPGNNSIAIGYFANASGDWATALGQGAFSTGNISVSVGYSANASAIASTAIGASAEASGNNSIALGMGSKSIGNYSVAIGGAKVGFQNEYAIAIGYNASNQIASPNSIALGRDAIAQGMSAIAIGCNSNASGSQVIAIGRGAKAKSEYTAHWAIAIGGAKASGNGSVAIGDTVEANGDYSLAIGKNVNTSGSSPIAIGYSVSTDGGIVLGKDAKVLNSASLAVGVGTGATNTYAIAIGGNAKASGDRSVALGNNANASGYRSVAIGDNAVANSSYPISIYGGTGIAAVISTEGGAWQWPSDERIKENIEMGDTSICLKSINNVPVKRYTYKNFVRKYADQHQLGFIAQDLEKVYPKLVSTSEVEEFDNPDNPSEKIKIKNFRRIEREPLIPVLWGGVQELSKIINEMQSRISELEKEISKIKA